MVQLPWILLRMHLGVPLYYHIFVVVWLLPAWQGFKETDSQEDCSWWCMLVIGKLVHHIMIVLFLVKDFLLRGQSSRSCRTSHLAGLLGDDGLSEALCGFSLGQVPSLWPPKLCRLIKAVRLQKSRWHVCRSWSLERIFLQQRHQFFVLQTVTSWEW